ncbi:hypothetical protein NDU88_004821 [Pleurodeles waltl]|uniref:Uncharacterized protein n=1 Tax=Pleurodeles waltl TaxID=8319 RepID=A0AAV7SK14_PLEWA|nr:hypothetical protein NDU88_004821 [Pleurodeles waltl]
MTGDIGAKTRQQLDKFTQPKNVARAPRSEVPWFELEITNPEEETLTLKDIMVAIQRVCGTPEFEINSVSTEVVLIRADIHVLGARVKETEVSLKVLKEDSTSLKKQVHELKATTATLEAKI